MKLATIFNDYFSKIVSSLQIPESNNIDPQYEIMSCPTLKSIMKYRRYPSITAIQDAYKGSSFSFSTVERVDVIREIKNLSKKKAIQDDDIPVKILKENVNFFAEYICIFCNHAIISLLFSRKEAKTTRKILDQSAFYQFCQKSFQKLIVYIYFL